MTTVNKQKQPKTIILSEYEHKKRLWMTLMSVNILEGIRFYVSFALTEQRL